MGSRIKMRRKELHIKQAELAETLEISNNHMSSIENGRQKPSLDTFIRQIYMTECLEYLDKENRWL